MTRQKNSPDRLRVGHLNARQPTPFALQPDADTRHALAVEMGLIALPLLEFRGQIRPGMNDAWELTGVLDARVTQPCVVTLAPVTTQLQEDVERVFTPHFAPPESEEAEMMDDTLEPLGQYIDLSAIMAESLSLALPPYPRAADADLPEDVKPAPDDPEGETRRPFAGLADLLSQKRD